MCGRYAIPDEAAVERLCAADFRRGFSWMRPLFNVAPTTQVPVIVQAPDGVGTTPDHPVRGRVFLEKAVLLGNPHQGEQLVADAVPA